jgi:hypothetical protein
MGMIEVEQGDLVPGLGAGGCDPQAGWPLGGGDLQGSDHDRPLITRSTVSLASGHAGRPALLTLQA